MGRLVSKKKVLENMRRIGKSPREIADLDTALPDPVDLKRDAAVLRSYGLSRSILMDRLGGSP